jgi:tetratricopeptide (TPR) repeat protein
MKEKLSTSGKSPVKGESDIQQLQARLSKKLKMIFFIPLAALIAVSYYAYDMSARLSQLEVGDRVNFIERTWKETNNINFAIQEYEKLAKEQKTPQLLVRLGALYYQRTSFSDLTKIGDIERAIQTLQAANALYQEKHNKEFCLANSTLASIYFDQEELEKAIDAGEKAIALNPIDVYSLNTLAWIYVTSPDPAFQRFTKAKQYANEAVKLTNRKEYDALDTLAVVYKRVGEIDEAVGILKAVIGNDRSIPKAALADLNQRLEELEKDKMKLVSREPSVG